MAPTEDTGTHGHTKDIGGRVHLHHLRRRPMLLRQHIRQQYLLSHADPVWRVEDPVVGDDGGQRHLLLGPDLVEGDRIRWRTATRTCLKVRMMRQRGRGGSRLGARRRGRDSGMLDWAGSLGLLFSLIDYRRRALEPLA